MCTYSKLVELKQAYTCNEEYYAIHDEEKTGRQTSAPDSDTDEQGDSDCEGPNLNQSISEQDSEQVATHY